MIHVFRHLYNQREVAQALWDSKILCCLQSAFFIWTFYKWVWIFSGSKILEQGCWFFSLCTYMMHDVNFSKRKYFYKLLRNRNGRYIQVITGIVGKLFTFFITFYSVKAIRIVYVSWYPFLDCIRRHIKY